MALIFEPFDTAENAMWIDGVTYEEGVNPLKASVNDMTLADRYYVDFASDAPATFPRIIKTVFSQVEVAPSVEQLPPHDLLLRIAVESKLLTRGEILSGIAAFGKVTAIGDRGETITEWSASDSEMTRKWPYWTQKTMAHAVGEPALEGMVDRLVEYLVTDTAINEYVQRKAIERARPSSLIASAAFDDSASYFPNGRLDAGEAAKLRVTVRNEGTGSAFAVKLHITAFKGATIAADHDLGDIAPAATRTLDIPIAGTVDLASAVPRLTIETHEKRGYDARPLLVEIATEQLHRPALEIADISLDKAPTNGETVEATLLVRNSGPGDAVGARLTMSATDGVELLTKAVDVPAIPANAVREVRAKLRVPVTFASAELALDVRAEEVRGAIVAKAERIAKWVTSLRRPALEATYKLYDGNSAQSTGNRDGTANNGETIELAFVPANRGPLEARGVTMKVASRVPSVTFAPDTFTIGTLPAFAEGSALRTRITIPRAFGVTTPIDKIPFDLTIAQTDFDSRVQTIQLPYATQRPRLTAHLTPLAPLVEGGEVTFALEIRNEGSLAAENVRVAVTSDNPAIEFLETSGAPVRAIEITAGSVAAQAALPRVTLNGHVRRNIASRAATVTAIATQNDFPPLEQSTTVDIRAEDVDVVRAEPAPAHENVVVRRAAGVPATISFQYASGEHVRQEQIIVPFEVQSQAALEIVRVEQNGRAVDPGAAQVISDAASFAWQYEPRFMLDYGENTIDVVAVTSEGVSSSRRITITRDAPKGRVWVAAVGISNYANEGVTDLQYAKDDADSILAYYREFGLPEEQLIELVDEQATLTNIKRTLGTQLVNKATNPEDTVILYFAGHGEKEPDSGSSDGYGKYLLPYDANASDLFSTALSMDELSRILQRLKPERVALIIDSCFSGAAGGRTLYDRDVNDRGVMITDDFLVRMATSGKGRVILTASSGQEVAHESAQFRHGVFTYFLLEGLRGGADYDGDGRVDADEIYRYVSQKVSAATHGQQNPVRKAPNQIGTIMLGRRLDAR